jgi:hypothetical protein
LSKWLTGVAFSLKPYKVFFPTLKPSAVKQASLNINKTARFGKQKKGLNGAFWQPKKDFVFNLVFFNIGLDSDLIIQTTEYKEIASMSCKSHSS